MTHPWDGFRAHQGFPQLFCPPSDSAVARACCPTYRILWLRARKGQNMVWDAEMIRQLRELWSEGLSTAEIGRRLGFSKNAIVGKAHRLDLSARPSPIRREAAKPSSPVSTPAAVTLPPLPSVGPALPVSSPPIATVRALRIVPETPPARPVMIVPPPAPSLAPLRPIPQPQLRRARTTCCWPMGEPGTRNFRFCEADAVNSKPYCEEHVKLAYVRLKERKDDAA